MVLLYFTNEAIGTELRLEPEMSKYLLSTAFLVPTTSQSRVLSGRGRA